MILLKKMNIFTAEVIGIATSVMVTGKRGASLTIQQIVLMGGDNEL